MAKDNTNRQEVKELMRLIDDLKNSSLRTDPELSQLEIRRAEFEKELENVKATIDRRKSTLAQIPDAIKQKKQELLAKVKGSRAICSSLENSPGCCPARNIENYPGCFELVIHRLTHVSCVKLTITILSCCLIVSLVSAKEPI